ncbi:proline dehydrogenase family protein [Tessaracoccus terricola]
MDASELTLLADDAVRLAARWRERAAAEETERERATGARLAGLLRDRDGLALAVKFVDEVARPEDTRAAATALAGLRLPDAGFLPPLDRLLLRVGARLAPLAPGLVVPLARRRLRQLVGHLVVDARDPALGHHLERARREGNRLNVNLLGEAVLGEAEAADRAARIVALLARADVDYVSVKVSALAPQVSTWDLPGTVARVAERLRPILRAAARRQPHAFVNLDMEEYRDLDVTLAVFEALLGEPEFAPLEAGIVLQAYLPDSVAAAERLVEFAHRRSEAGQAAIKIRLVKGANLAMEAVEAEVHGCPQAPYDSKADVDANYLRLVERLLRPDATSVLRLGVASHNLFDVAAAHLLAQRRDVTDRLDAEMLQGMAPAEARVVRDDVGSMVLYTPIVAPADFDVAVAYLVRRLEENAQPQNYLHAAFSTATGPDSPMARQETRFRESLAAAADTPTAPRRTGERPEVGDRFANTPDSDPALAATRAWAAEVVLGDPGEPTSPEADVTAVDAAVATALAAAAGWAADSPARRAQHLRRAARELETRRGELVAAMAAEGGKTIEQSDPEVSEAVDFARWYADSAEDLGAGHPMTDGTAFTPPRVTLVTPPWNFPVAIPIGGVLAALAAGSAVVIKPAPGVERCTEIAVEALWAAGIPDDVVQVLRAGEGDAGRRLVSHPDMDLVVLTGAVDTARLFQTWRTGRAGGPAVHAETSGKNALVITPAADLDLAVQDLVRSAFGHAGQKCSAASLGILVGSVGTSARFERQLVDTVRSLRVGWPDDLGATVGPVIEPPHGKLLRALTTLEPGERWVVEPVQLDGTGRLWRPGVRSGVRPGSFFHTTEAFGPVLGLMHAHDLEQALEWQDATRFGLTGGIHSLDDAEVATWLERVEVGNAYINRVTTGAVVGRQPFGGWKDSAVGPGAKAGGPNYVASLGSWEADGLPTLRRTPPARVRALAARLAPLVDPSEQDWLAAAVGSDAHAFATELGQVQDLAGLRSEANLLRYRSVPQLVIHCGDGARPAELARLLLAAELTGTPVRVSLAPSVSVGLEGQLSATGPGRAVLEELAGLRVVDLAAHLADAARDTRVRLLGSVGSLPDELAAMGVAAVAGPVLANGRRELLTCLREQSISRTLHRFGQVPPGARGLI